MNRNKLASVIGWLIMAGILLVIATVSDSDNCASPVDTPTQACYEVDP